MKKLLLLLLVVITTLLSSCSAEAEQEGPSSYTFDSYLTYNFNTATFNNTQPEDILYDIHHYQKEFDQMIDIAIISGIISEELTDNEATAFADFFTKLEQLNHHSLAIFNMNASQLQQQFDSSSITITALDIFTFEAIKELFSTIETQAISISKEGFIITILERDITDSERDGINLLYTINNDLYEKVNDENTFTEAKAVLDSNNYVLTTEELENLEDAYNLFQIIR